MPDRHHPCRRRNRDILELHALRRRRRNPGLAGNRDADLSESKHDACPFCERLEAGDIIAQNDLAAALKDAFPVSPGHTLIVPKRHEPNFFSLSRAEVKAIFELVNLAKQKLDPEFNPDGYNIGINEGAAAGQTVFHVHVHLIPRFHGDVPEPRGGIRWIKPDRAKYWEK